MTINFNDLMSRLKKNLPEIAFAAYSIRLISLGASIGDAVALISLVGIFGFFRFMDRKKVDQYDELKTEIEHIKNMITSVKAAQGLTQSKGRTPLNDNSIAQTPKRYF